MFQTILGLLGGLALFIFGMNLMSNSLQSVAGNKMKQILGFLMKNPILGVLAGALCTAVLQSSSATTVTVIGFVSAELMTLPQAISVILGANIGTTITAQLLAFKISDYIYVFFFSGFSPGVCGKIEKAEVLGRNDFRIWTAVCGHRNDGQRNETACVQFRVYRYDRKGSRHPDFGRWWWVR